jgi:hypothetical protein
VLYEFPYICYFRDTKSVSGVTLGGTGRHAADVGYPDILLTLKVCLFAHISMKRREDEN